MSAPLWDNRCLMNHRIGHVGLPPGVSGGGVGGGELVGAAAAVGTV